MGAAVVAQRAVYGSAACGVAGVDRGLDHRRVVGPAGAVALVTVVPALVARCALPPLTDEIVVFRYAPEVPAP